jgi:hypothetical protein
VSRWHRHHPDEPHPFAWQLETRDCPDDDALENEPYCICDLDPTEDEDASNTCACCGKLLS